jgi:hypothetical protein
LDKNKSININLMNSKSEWINRYKEIIMKNGFVFYGNTVENGVPVNTFIKSPNIMK